MSIYTILAYSLLLISILTFFVGLKGRPHFYWLSALTIYFFSFLGGFSIGQFTVGLTFIPLMLGVAGVFGWMRKKYHTAFFVGLGIILGILAVIFIGNGLFYPIFILFN